MKFKLNLVILLRVLDVIPLYFWNVYTRMQVSPSTCLHTFFGHLQVFASRSSVRKLVH